jgi:hypothetical protein
MREAIEEGQLVSRWELRGNGPAGIVLAEGTTIGYRRLRRVAPVEVSSLWLSVQTLDTQRRVRLTAYA